ncbi:MAG: KilA-N domain-containing protein [Bacteroidales bacterium]|jgi:hypothetical protein|nr:KilA-N domain-containing protein [Bacteroidales bacterium]
MKTVKFAFEGSEITFTLDTENKVMVNATEMAKIFNAEVARFMENKSTKDFISVCLKTRNSAFLNDEKSAKMHFLDIENEEDLYTSKQKSGTFMHRILALKFAAWLSPEFELWVYSTIDKLLFGRHAKREESFKTSAILKKEISRILKKDSKTIEDFDRYLEISQQLTAEENKRKSLTMECINEIKSAVNNQYDIDFPDE